MLNMTGMGLPSADDTIADDTGCATVPLCQDASGLAVLFMATARVWIQGGETQQVWSSGAVCGDTAFFDMAMGQNL